ncbi:Low-affinity cation transporter [Rhynchospora pubera]|uniref:Low-affinity cation transporter n=1 Tax=Rhynchospora pubera TaxID=906938 RepID=A0AAV8BYU3_9POAL|nr:Low-affinity cation transporter [Rhynchospora pubera]
MEIVTGAASPAAIENLTSEQMEEIWKPNPKTNLEFSSFVVLIGFSELSGILFLPKNPAKIHHLRAIAALGFLTLSSGFGLMIYTFVMLAQRNTLPHQIHQTISRSFYIASWAALILASAVPLSLLPNPYSLLIPIMLGAILLALGVHLFLRTNSSDKKIVKDKTDEEHVKEITRLSDLSQAVVSLSLGGLIGLLFGIDKTDSKASHRVVLVTFCLTFTSFIFGIFLMPLCQMGVMHLNPSTRKHFLTIGVELCKFLLILLAFAALAISVTFLKWYTFLVCTPVVIVYGVWQSIYLSTRDPQDNQDSMHEEEFKLAYTKANKVTSVSFGVMMAIFSGYLGSPEKNMHLNICMIFMTASFISALILMLLSYKPSTRSHIGLVVSILGYFAISLLAFGAFIIFILVVMQL